MDARACEVKSCEQTKSARHHGDVRGRQNFSPSRFGRRPVISALTTFRKALAHLVDLCSQSRQPIAKVALVADVRGGEFFRDLTDAIGKLRSESYEVRIFFLEASDEVLVQRYKEARRRHPLSNNGRDLLQAIQLEREQLAEIRELADEVIDTSGLNTTTVEGRNLEAASIGRWDYHASQGRFLRLQIRCPR